MSKIRDPNAPPPTEEQTRRVVEAIDRWLKAQEPSSPEEAARQDQEVRDFIRQFGTIRSSPSLKNSSGS